ncbi:ABC transporter ATP-binding protein [Marinobacter sp. ATCH36]|uniref:ABC transporter ATP-binding protein n=1 Tax=Marinobacter sp. ATCH36 TaxID=2945106 RepID=UPI0020205C2E|nr:ABC transporter ATP-binding protein [Marinobacter sp. ATCH36]MCL7946158.1 ABC transporter ATP-binding protein [Marinobacter sp. ATCH36]
MLTLANIDVVYDGVIQVLRSTNIEVRQGQMVVLLGANGAGKTTTLKAISALLHADQGAVTAGRITFEDRDITHADPTTIVKSGIVQVLEGRKVLEHLSVLQNLMVGAHLRKDRAGVREDLEKVYHYFPALPNLLHRTAGYLSGGEMQMVLIGRALMAQPKLLILDEPSMGLAPNLSQQLFRTIEQIKREEGLTVLLVEQNARSAIAQCDYGYIMEGGRIVLHGSRNELTSNQDVQEFYLGTSNAADRTSYRDVKHYRRRKRWLG